MSENTLSEYSENYLGEGADLVVFPFHSVGEVRFERELRGETSHFEDVAILSREAKGIVICGCYTNARGILRKSAVVAENGKILGVSDMVNCIDEEKFSPGAGIRVYDTKAGKIGVVVGEDLYFPYVIQTLSICGAELIVCVFEEITDNVERTLIRAEAFFYGVPICFCAYGYAQVADGAGRLVYASPESPGRFSLPIEKEYHLVETRRRGYSKRGGKEY
ncbi:MAG: carbon-nitrogen hydrolase family protein [Clostridia bacterium]|nr:carbon-nitrogen hydrolase family protein [Clostridia bacterium]